jgi:hypothetical protein
MFAIRSLLCLAVLLLVSSPASLLGQSVPTITTNSPGMVRLGWKPSPSENVAGYFLCWGFASGQCTNRLDAGNVTTVNVAGLQPGVTYFFTVIAYSAFGDEAPPSNEVSYCPPLVPLNHPPTMDPIANLTLLENSVPQTVLITGIGPGSSSENQTVGLSAISSKPLLIDPVVHYGTPSTSATLTFIVAPNAIGTATITVVADDGQLTNNVTTRTFEVTVIRANPPLTPLTNVTIAPYSTFTYAIPVPFPGTNGILYRLEPGAPVNANLVQHGGIAVFTWMPTSSHASTTNLITVRATDTENPGLTTNLLFAVTVTDYLAVMPCASTVEAGTQAVLPFHLVSSEPVTSLTFTVSWPSDALANPSLTLASNSIFGSSLQVQGTNLQITLTAGAGLSLVGSNHIGTLDFSASPNQLSSFVPIRTTVLSATKPDGKPFVGLFPGLGEIVVVADHPLLRALAGTDSARMLNLYGRVGATYRLQYATNSLSNLVWQHLLTYAQTNVVQSLAIDSSNPAIFYRLEQQ